jgi:hypothetical protein
MTIRYYQDFVIDLARVENAPADQSGRHTKFSVKVFDSPMGESTTGQEIDIGDWGRLDQWLEGLDSQTITQAELEKFGHFMGEWLLPGGKSDLNAPASQNIFTVRELFDSSFTNLTKEEGMRIRMRLAPELTELPWEFASITEEGGYGSRLLYLGTHPQLSIVRHEVIAGQQRKEFGIVPRIKVVYAMASPKHPRFRHLEIVEEQNRLKKELSGLTSLNIQYIPDFAGTQQAYGANEEEIIASQIAKPTPDIFHFTGHGVWKKQGFILLAQPETGRAIGISGAKLAEWLSISETLRLVILECCESAKNEWIAQKRNNVAIELLNKGIPAVIGMQYEIYYEFATVFTDTLYRYLVAGLTIDEAVTQGRKKVREFEESSQQVSLLRAWGTPVLYLRNSGGNFFPPDSNRQRIFESLPEQIRLDATLNDMMRQWINEENFLASSSQLDELQAKGDKLTADPLEVLLLLKSAVQHSRNIRYWTGMLEKSGRKFLMAMQVLKIDRGRKTLDLAEKTLGIDGFKITEPPAGIDNLSWSAATHPESLVSKTATLALSALKEEQAPGLIENALKVHNGALSRRIECFGALAEARENQDFLVGLYPKKPDVIQKLCFFRDFFLVWFWRFLIYWKNNRVEIILRSLYAGLGAGLALGLYRTFLTLVNQNPWGSEFAINSIFGFLAGWLISFGMGITSPMLLLNVKENDLSKPSLKRKKLLWLQIPLGALGFSILNGLVLIFTTEGLAAPPFFRCLLTSFLAGLLIVGVALYRQSSAVSPGTRPDIKKRLVYLFIHLVTLMVLLAFLQLPVLWERTNSPVTQLVFGQIHRWRVSPLNLSSTMIRDRYQVKVSFKKMILQCDPDLGTKSCYAACANGHPPTLAPLFTNCFEQWLSVIDLALIGFFLSVGMIFAIASIPYLLDKLRR